MDWCVIMPNSQEQVNKAATALLNLKMGEELTLDFRNQDNQKKLMKFKRVM